MRNPLALMVVATVLLAAAEARGSLPAETHAGESDFGLGIGYCRIDFDSGNPLIDGRDGIHFDPYIAWAPFQDLPQLRIGLAGAVSTAIDDTKGAFVSSGGGAIFVSGDVSLALFEPEVRISWRHHFGPDDLYYLEAGVAGGGVFAWIDGGNDASGADFEDNEAAWSARAFVRLGIPVSDGMAGLEASYLRGGHMHFADDLEGDPEVFYFGVFGSLSF